MAEPKRQRKNINDYEQLYSSQKSKQKNKKRERSTYKKLGIQGIEAEVNPFCSQGNGDEQLETHWPEAEVAGGLLAEDSRAKGIKEIAVSFINGQRIQSTSLQISQYINVVLKKVLQKLIDIVSRIKGRIIQMQQPQGFPCFRRFRCKFINYRQWMDPQEADSFTLIFKILYQDSPLFVSPSKMLSLYRMIRAKYAQNEFPFCKRPAKPEIEGPSKNLKIEPPRKKMKIDNLQRNRIVLTCYLMSKKVDATVGLLNKKYKRIKFTAEDVEDIIRFSMERSLDKYIKTSYFYAARRLDGKVIELSPEDRQHIFREPMDQDLKNLLVRTTILEGLLSEVKVNSMRALLQSYIMVDDIRNRQQFKMALYDMD